MRHSTKKRTPRRGMNPAQVADSDFDGTRLLPEAPNSALQRGISRRIVYTVLCGVMTPSKAKQLAGYEDSTKPPELVDPRTPAEIRERLQSIAGVTLADQIGFYADAREDDNVPMTERISAAKQIDKVLGYEAPTRVEIQERKQIFLALQTFQAVLAKNHISPRQLVEIADAQIEDHSQDIHPEVVSKPKVEVGDSLV
jgi:hypothetical protein